MTDQAERLLRRYHDVIFPWIGKVCHPLTKLLVVRQHVDVFDHVI